MGDLLAQGAWAYLSGQAYSEKVRAVLKLPPVQGDGTLVRLIDLMTSNIARWVGTLLAFLAGLVFHVHADSTLVFNEVHYQPETNEPAMEWIELHNQLAVDLDVSKWSLDGAVSYVFPTPTVVRGGGYLVVAGSPATVASSAGITNVIGGYTNLLPNSGGQLRLRDNTGRKVNSLDYDAGGDWPVGPAGGGVSLAKLDRTTTSGKAGNWTASAQIGGTPGYDNFPTLPQAIYLAFNETSTTTNTEFWVELFNYGTNTLSLEGYVVAHRGSTNTDYVIPSEVQLLPGRGIALTNITLGFLPAKGDRLLLYPPTRTQVIDAIRLGSAAEGRSPDGTGAWQTPSLPSPGASNLFNFQTEVVINEIMYHQKDPPPTNAWPAAASDEEWIELFNRGTNVVNLTDWRLDGGISYKFLSGQKLGPGAYLVVARDAAALRTKYPAINIVGNYGGKLSQNGDSITLEDAAGNRADRVKYFRKRKMAIPRRWRRVEPGTQRSLGRQRPS